MLRQVFFGSVFATALAVVACGSSTTPAGTGATTSSTHSSTTTSATSGSGSTTTSTSGSTATSGSTSGSGTSTSSGGTGGAAACQDACVTNNMTGAMEFEGYELKECGCGDAGSPCASDCTAECANPSSLTQTSACGVCLRTQADMGTSSTCTLKAAEVDCTDTACQSFVTCGLACP